MKLISIIFSIICYATAERSFTIDFKNNQFLRDGKPFRYVSGDLEYFKVPSALWRERMIKHKAAGLNAIQTYIEWSLHEPEHGIYDFSGDRDIESFLKLAKELDFVVILRPGPFIACERDNGGLPYWLLTVKEGSLTKFRTSDPIYLKEVDRWYSILMPKIIPHLYKNGGPIITVQVENEYGLLEYCDFKYMTHLRDLFHKYLGNDIVLFTVDPLNDKYFECGKIDNVLATIDFGAGDAEIGYEVLRRHQEFGPFVNSEYYPGWVDLWGQPHQTASIEAVCKTLDKILSLNGSVNIYPLHGGTSFGFHSGASGSSRLLNWKRGFYLPQVTSYDFDAPLTESGDPTPKYFAIREVIGKYLPLPNMSLPVISPKMELTPINVYAIKSIYDEEFLKNPIKSVNPKPFELVFLNHGFILYSTNISVYPSDPSVLRINGLADRAQVFVDEVFQGILSQTLNISELTITADFGQRLDIFVENQGRLGTQDLKGIHGSVTLNHVTLKNWTHHLYFKNWDNAIKSVESDADKNIVRTVKENTPTFYSGTFVLPNDTKLPYDTFLRLDGWRKGNAFLNGFNLGRYWPIMGPQITLYAPSHLFKKYPEKNFITLFDLEGSSCVHSHQCKVKFVKEHVINGTTPPLIKV